MTPDHNQTFWEGRVTNIFGLLGCLNAIPALLGERGFQNEDHQDII